MPAGIRPTVFMMASAVKAPSGEQRHQGVACISARDFRWERGDIKSISLLGNVLARQMSADHGAIETIMYRNGFLTEASASNVWVVHEGALLGPPKSEHVLEGIRYELMRELCEECGIAYNLRPLAESDVTGADELLLSSATKEVLPVTQPRWRRGRPRHPARQARAGVCEALRGLPAGQADAVDLRRTGR